MIKNHSIVNFLGGEIQVGGLIAPDKSHVILTLKDMDKPEPIGTNIIKSKDEVYNEQYELIIVFHHKESIDVVINQLNNLKNELL